MSKPAREICDKCGKPVKPGDARYTGGEFRGIYRHADCHDWRSPGEKLAELNALAEKLKVRLRNLR